MRTPILLIPSGWNSGAEKCLLLRFHFFSQGSSHLTPEILSLSKSLRNSSEQSHFFCYNLAVFCLGKLQHSLKRVSSMACVLKQLAE